MGAHSRRPNCGRNYGRNADDEHGLLCIVAFGRAEACGGGLITTAITMHSDAELASPRGPRRCSQAGDPHERLRRRRAVGPAGVLAGVVRRGVRAAAGAPRPGRRAEGARVSGAAGRRARLACAASQDRRTKILCAPWLGSCRPPRGKLAKRTPGDRSSRPGFTQ